MSPPPRAGVQPPADSTALTQRPERPSQGLQVGGSFCRPSVAFLLALNFPAIRSSGPRVACAPGRLPVLLVREAGARPCPRPDGARAVVGPFCPRSGARPGVSGSSAMLWARDLAPSPGWSSASSESSSVLLGDAAHMRWAPVETEELFKSWLIGPRRPRRLASGLRKPRTRDHRWPLLSCCRKQGGSLFSLMPALPPLCLIHGPPGSGATNSLFLCQDPRRSLPLAGSSQG